MDGTAVEPPLKEEAPHHTCTCLILFGSVFPLWQDIRDSPLLLPFEVCVSNDFPWESGNTDMETQRWQGINSLWMVSESIWHWGLKNTKKKQFWKHFTILQGSPKRWKIGVAETLTEYYCGSLFKVCNTETKYTLKLSSASRASRGAIFSKKKRIS